VKVSDAMTAQVTTAQPTDSIQSVAKIMKSIDTGAVPVFADGKVIGMVTDRDIVLRVVAEGRSFADAISDVMTDEVQSCKAEDNLADAAAQMANHQLRRLIVTDDNGKLAGILSLGDIAVDYGNKQVGHTLEEISADVGG
jgi:CBS domain-containing protein